MGKGKFKYDVVKESSVGAYEELPKYFLADTPEKAEQLYKDHYTLLNNLSYTYSISTNIDKSDFFGEALVGLARANRDFDSERSNNFRTFAIYKIKSALNEYVRKNSRSVIMPAYIRNANRHIMLLKNVFETHNLNPEYLLEAFDVGILKMDWAKTSSLKWKIHALFDKLVKAAERASISVKELVSRAEFAPTDVKYDDYVNIEDITQQEGRRLQLAIIVENIKNNLTPIEIRICEGIMEDKTYETIAAEFGHKAPWVNQQLNRMRKKLKGNSYEL